MLTLTERVAGDSATGAHWALALTAEERTRSRHRFTTTEGEVVQLLLPRGTVLREGDVLRGENPAVLVRVRAKPEPVMTVRAAKPSDLMRAAYHLGNRHVPLELAADCLRLSPDSVLADMLRTLGLTVSEEIAAFHPEPGAYGGHAHRAPFVAGFGHQHG